MKYPIFAENIKRLMRQLGVDQTVLGDMVGVSQGTVSRWGESAPRGKTITALAALAGVTPKQFMEELIPDREFGMRPVRVVGFVGAGALVYAYEAAGLNDDQPTVDIPAEITGNAAVVVKGNSLAPEAEEGWHVIYMGGKTADIGSVVGHLCVVQLEDERMLVKRVEKGARRGTYDLISTNADPMIGQRLLWAARVTAIIPN